jgi:hypothetical protein
MNERIKELAKQAGFHISSSNFGDIGWVWCSDGYPIDEQLERFAEIVRQDQREACARLVEEFVPKSFYVDQLKGAAAEIRARGNK